VNITYDKIGDSYDFTRKADPKIVARFRDLLNIKRDKNYLDIACGTGNYTIEMAKIGGKWSAFDHSEKMLKEARPKSVSIRWDRFDVENTNYKSDFFDGVICSLAIHHFPDLYPVFKEIARVLKPKANFIIFTTTPEQMSSYWLSHYFPIMMEKSIAQMPSQKLVTDALEQNNLVVNLIDPFFIYLEITDFFLYSGKQRPQMYLSPSIRAGISSFRNLCPEQELKNGLKQLKSDIKSCAISEVMVKYKNKIGDYIFIVASKTNNVI